MTPLLKLKIRSHLRIERLRSTLPNHPEFAVSGCICYGYKTPESPLYLAFQIHYSSYAYQTHCHSQSRLYRTDAERQKSAFRLTFSSDNWRWIVPRIDRKRPAFGSPLRCNDANKWRGGDVLASQYVLRQGCHERQQASQECAEANPFHMRVRDLVGVFIEAPADPPLHEAIAAGR
jgi:hypothetical protein